MQYEDDGKYLILQRGDMAWHMYDVRCTDDSIYAKLDIQLGYQINYLNPNKTGRNKFHKRTEAVL